MAFRKQKAESDGKTVWNAYIDQHKAEPRVAQDLFTFSKTETSLPNLKYSQARTIFDQLKSKGKTEAERTHPTHQWGIHKIQKNVENECAQRSRRQ